MAAFAVAGVVWAAVFWRRGGTLIAGCLAVMLAGACFSVPFFKIEAGPAPLTIDRIAFALLCVAFIFAWRWGLTSPKPISRADFITLVFVAAVTLSALTADFTAKNFQGLSWLIIYYWMPLGMYWIARYVVDDERSQKILFASLAVFGVYLALTGLAEYKEAWSVVFPSYIQATPSSEAEFVGRARGPFLNPIGNGITLCVCLGASLMLWPGSTRRRQLLVAAAAAVITLGIGLTLTRSVWMSGGLTLAICVGLALPWNWRLPLLGGAALVAMLLTVAQWDNLVAFKRDKNLSADKTAESVELRPVLARIAWLMFQDRPLFGCGYSQYGQEHLAYLNDRSTNLPLEKGRPYIQHNVFLSLLTETGAIGVGLFIMTLSFWTRDAWRLWRSTCSPLGARQCGMLALVAVGAYALNGMFHEVSVIPMDNMTLFFLTGVMSGRSIGQTSRA